MRAEKKPVPAKDDPGYQKFLDDVIDPSITCEGVIARWKISKLTLTRLRRELGLVGASRKTLRPATLSERRKADQRRTRLLAYPRPAGIAELIDGR